MISLKKLCSRVDYIWVEEAYIYMDVRRRRLDKFVEKYDMLFKRVEILSCISFHMNKIVLCENNKEQ